MAPWIFILVSDSAYYAMGIILASAHIIGVICTVLLLLFDRICCCCCCCDCWRGQQEVVVYDPDHPEASLVWRDGEVINIGINQVEKTSIEVVEMNTKEDEGEEPNKEIKPVVTDIGMDNMEKTQKHDEVDELNGELKLKQDK